MMYDMIYYSIGLGRNLWARVPTYIPPTWPDQGGGMGAGRVTKRTCFLIGLFLKRRRLYLIVVALALRVSVVPFFEHRVQGCL